MRNYWPVGWLGSAAGLGRFDGGEEYHICFRVGGSKKMDILRRYS